MKRLSVLIPFVAVALAGCNKPSTSVENTSVQPEVTQPLPPPPSPSSSTAPEKVTSTSSGTEAPKPEPEPAPPAKQLAPAGTLFVTERVRITTDEGIRAVNPGTQVKIIRKTDSGYVVADKLGEFPVEAGQVTDEVAAASGALQAHRAETSASAAASQAQSQAAAQLLQAQKQQAAIDGQAAAKEKRVRDLEARRSALVREEAALTAKIAEVDQEEQRHYSAPAYGRVSTRSFDPRQRAAWVARRTIVRDEKQAVMNEIYQSR